MVSRISYHFNDLLSDYFLNQERCLSTRLGSFSTDVHHLLQVMVSARISSEWSRNSMSALYG